MCFRFILCFLAPGSLHSHRGQADVTVDLHGVNVVEGGEAVFIGVSIHPIHHDSVGVILTADGQRKSLSTVEGHPSTPLLRAPLLILHGVADHAVLVETWVVMQSDDGLSAKIHIEPGGVGVDCSLDGDDPTRTESTADGTIVWDGRHLRRKSRLRGEAGLRGKCWKGWESSMGGVSYLWSKSRECWLSWECRGLEGNGGNFHFASNTDAVDLLKRDTVPVFHKVGSIDHQLVEITGDSDGQVEGTTSRNKGVLLPFLRAPVAKLEGVGDHVSVTFITWVKMKSNVSTTPCSTL